MQRAQLQCVINKEDRHCWTYRGMGENLTVTYIYTKQPTSKERYRYRIASKLAFNNHRKWKLSLWRECKL